MNTIGRARTFLIHKVTKHLTTMMKMMEVVLHSQFHKKKYCEEELQNLNYK